MEGGVRSDTYHATAGDIILELAGFENGMGDKVIADTSWTLEDNVEALELLEGAPGAIRGTGNTGQNVIHGNSAANVLDGGDGGGDTVFGAGGDDTITGTHLFLAYGEDGNDVITSGPNGDLEGGAGDDRIEGGRFVSGGFGNDTIVNAPGFTEIDGGPGSDTFLFARTPDASDALLDRYRDFVSGQDQLRFDGRAFAQLGASGALAAGDERFYAAPGADSAHDATDRFIYNRSTGDLWYDPDGSGAATSFRMGILRDVFLDSPAANLQATDIVIINGTSSPDRVINGTGGNDSLAGGAGNDTINGFAGLDTIDGGVGADSMVGGDGPDLYFVDNAGDVIVELQNGGMDEVRSTVNYALSDWVNNLTLVGSVAFNGFGNAIDNVLTGNALDNRLFGGVGADTLIGGNGNDTLQGQAMGDMPGWERAADTLNGGLGHDEYGVDSVNDLLLDDGGIDKVVAYDMSWTLGAGFEHLEIHNDVSESAFTGIGNELDNFIYATWAGSRLEGRGGSDTLTGASGQGNGNTLIGGDGDDSLVNHGTFDTFDGGAGNDIITSDGDDLYVFSVAPGSANADELNGFVSGRGTIQLDGSVHASSGASGRFTAGDARFWSSGTGVAHDGDDRVIYNSSNGQLWYDADGNGGGAAQLIATLENTAGVSAGDIGIVNGSGGGGGGGGTTVNGTAGNDTLSGTAGNDTINGLGGNDTILGSTGSDVIDGGAGFDSIEYKNAAGALVVDFAAGTISGGTAGNMSFIGIERIVAGNSNDQMTGNAASQTLTGQNGNDTIAGAGAADTLWGGAGADVFIFREMGSANADRISDWASGSDKVQLDDSAFTAIGALGNFAAGDARFWAAAGATSGHDANDRVVYNTSTGSLYYDADGSGSGAAQLIATFAGNPAVAATDIAVI